MTDSMTDPMTRVSRFSDHVSTPLIHLLERYGMVLELERPGAEIPGSFWGEEEAGLIGNSLKVRKDTPLHSILHETCHYICMDEKRRNGLNTDAGGGYDEENAVCYLQILLSDELPGFDRQHMMNDMDTWGYTFRLGSAKAWFDQDAEDARAWLLSRKLITANDAPTFELRTGNHRPASSQP
jgi:hypothetical protein